MESVPLASNGPPRYNGSYLSGPGAPEEDFGPETDVDGDSAALVKRHIQEEVMKASAKGLGSGDHVLQLSSDSEEGEGEEGGGWNFVQTPSGKKNTPPIGTNFDSEDSEDDMNHPLNPDAAEFVPVHSPVRKSHSGEEEFFASKNGNGVDAHNGKREDGKGTRWDDEDPVIACSPQKPNILDRLENERDFLSDIQKRPSSGFENGDHEEMNGFQSLDSSHTHATLGDATYLSDLTSPAVNHIGSGDVTTSSLSPSSPELHTGATTNPFDLSSVSNALDNVANDQSHDLQQNAKDDQDDFGFKASPCEDNRFSNDFTGTNQEVMENETLVTPIVETGRPGETDETRVGQHDAEKESHTTVGSDTLNGLRDPKTKPTPDTLNTASGELLPGRQVARSPVSPVLDLTSTSFGFASPAVRNSTVNEPSPRDKLSDTLDDNCDIYSIKTLSPVSGSIPSNSFTLPEHQDVADLTANSFTLPEHQDVADFTASQFDANTFSEFHTANDASGMFEKTNETSGFFGKDQTQTDLTLPSHVRLSVAEETITSMMDLIDTPQARRVSGEVLDAYNSVVHSMDTPSPQHTTLDISDDFGFNQSARETLESFAKPKEEDFSDNGYVEKHVDEVKSEGVGETQEDSCEKRGVPQGSDAAPESETNSNPFGDQTHHTETDEFEFHQEANVNSAVSSAPDDLMEKLERETEVQTFIIGGTTPMDFLQKYSGDSRSAEFTDEIHGIHKDEESRQDDFVGSNANKDSIKEEEEEEEIQIGKKVSDLNESDIMSRSFYGDYESQEVARSPSPEEMIDHYAGRQHEMLVEDPMEPGEQELTPTGDAKTLEAKLAEEHSHHVEDKPQEDSPQCPIVEEKPEEDSPQFHHVEETPEEDRPQYSNEEKPLKESQQVHHADEKPSTMFDISHEETSFTEKAEEVFDDLTFETKLNESSLQAEPKSPVAVTMETNLDDFASQETKLDAGIIECQPLEGTKPEEHSEETVVSAPTIPDVVPTQGDDGQSTPVVDLTQDIVEDSKVPPQDDGKASAEEPTVDKATAEIVEEPKETCASDVASTVAAVGALAAGAAAATVAVKKATSAAKKPSTSSVTKKPDVKPANKTSATKPLLKPSVAKTSSKPAGPVAAPAKPATKTVAPKPLVSRPAAKTAAPKPATTSTAAPKTSSTSTAAPKPTAPRKPIAGSTVTKTTASSSSANPKPAAAKPAAPKPRPASSVATKPLTNGVTKRPTSATSTAAAPSKPPAAARVPLSLRTSAAKPLTTAKTSVSSTAKPSTTAKSSVTAPKSSTTAAKTSAAALNSSKSSTQAKSPSAAAAAVAAARKSPLTRRPLSNPAKGKSTPSAMTKTEPRTEAEAVIRKPVPPPGETASVEVMTNGH